MKIAQLQTLKHFQANYFWKAKILEILGRRVRALIFVSGTMVGIVLRTHNENL